jgi:hypothetical protein
LRGWRQPSVVDGLVEGAIPIKSCGVLAALDVSRLQVNTSEDTSRSKKGFDDRPNKPFLETAKRMAKSR